MEKTKLLADDHGCNGDNMRWIWSMSVGKRLTKWMTHEMTHLSAGIENTQEEAEGQGQYVQYKDRLAADVFGREEE